MRIRTVVLFTAALIVLTANAEAGFFDKKQAKKTGKAHMQYRINGIDMQIRHYRSPLAPGDFIGRVIYDAQQSGLEVTDGPAARMIATIFAGKDDVYDCVYTQPKTGRGTLYLAKDDAKTGCMAAEISIPVDEPDVPWYDDGVAKFSGTEWFLSVELVYPEGYSNFSNIYFTKKTDLKAVIAHYTSALKRDGWSLLTEKEEPGSFICVAMKGEKVYLLSVKLMGNRQYLVNITG